MSTTAPTNQHKKHSNKHVVTKPVSKHEENKTIKKTKKTESKDECSVFDPICGPASSLSLPYWDYNLNMVIHNNLEETSYTVCDLVKGYVDKNGHPTGKERE